MIAYAVSATIDNNSILSITFDTRSTVDELSESYDIVRLVNWASYGLDVVVVKASDL